MLYSTAHQAKAAFFASQGGAHLHRPPAVTAAACLPLTVELQLLASALIQQQQQQQPWQQWQQPWQQWQWQQPQDETTLTYMFQLLLLSSVNTLLLCQIHEGTSTPEHQITPDSLQQLIGGPASPLLHALLAPLQQQDFCTVQSQLYGAWSPGEQLHALTVVLGRSTTAGRADVVC
jgi:hypothetical protein